MVEAEWRGEERRGKEERREKDRKEEKRREKERRGEERRGEERNERGEDQGREEERGTGGRNSLLKRQREIQVEIVVLSLPCNFHRKDWCFGSATNRV